MPWSLDARIPILIVAEPAALEAELTSGPPAAVLLAGSSWPGGAPAGAVALGSFDISTPTHAPACTCCGGRPPAAAALDRLFQARIRHACPWFERVIALARTEAARTEIAAALLRDAVTAARFRAG